MGGGGGVLYTKTYPKPTQNLPKPAQNLRGTGTNHLHLVSADFHGAWTSYDQKPFAVFDSGFVELPVQEAPHKKRGLGGAGYIPLNPCLKPA